MLIMVLNQNYLKATVDFSLPLSTQKPKEPYSHQTFNFSVTKFWLLRSSNSCPITSLPQQSHHHMQISIRYKNDKRARKHVTDGKREKACNLKRAGKHAPSGKHNGWATSGNKLQSSDSSWNNAKVNSSFLLNSNSKINRKHRKMKQKNTNNL